MDTTTATDCNVIHTHTIKIDTIGRLYRSWDYSAAYKALQKQAAPILEKSIYTVRDEDLFQLRQLVNAMELMRAHYTCSAQEEAKRSKDENYESPEL